MNGMQNVLARSLDRFPCQAHSLLHKLSFCLLQSSVQQLKQTLKALHRWPASQRLAKALLNQLVRTFLPAPYLLIQAPSQTDRTVTVGTTASLLLSLFIRVSQPSLVLVSKITCQDRKLVAYLAFLNLLIRGWARSSDIVVGLFLQKRSVLPLWQKGLGQLDNGTIASGRCNPDSLCSFLRISFLFVLSMLNCKVSLLVSLDFQLL